MHWVEKSVIPSLEKIRESIGNDVYYEWIMKSMDSVKLKQKATEQIRVHHNTYGAPISEIPF